MVRRIKKFVSLFLLKSHSTESEVNQSKNIYGTTFYRNALLAYITEPFLETELKPDRRYRHTRFKAALFIGKALQTCQYNVDIINFDDNTNISLENYDIIIGFGIPLEKAFYQETKNNVIKVFYGTGYNPIISNDLTINMAYTLYQKTGKWHGKLTRVVNYSWPFQWKFSDSYVILGNEVVASSYKKIGSSNMSIKTLDSFYHKELLMNKWALNNKINSANNLVISWFGSTGSVHKGLINLIDALNLIQSKGLDVELKVCGLSSEEWNVVSDYCKFIGFKSIENMGFINLSSTSDLIKLENVSFNVFPSISEGGGPSILNLMSVVGIPSIATKFVGLAPNCLYAELDDEKVNTIFKALSKAMRTDKKTYSIAVQEIYENIRINYTEERYFDNWCNIIKDLNQ